MSCFGMLNFCAISAGVTWLSITFATRDSGSRRLTSSIVMMPCLSIVAIWLSDELMMYFSRWLRTAAGSFVAVAVEVVEPPPPRTASAAALISSGVRFVYWTSAQGAYSLNELMAGEPP